jgi:hypothetical protein
LFKQIESEIYEANTKPAANDIGKVNVTEYAGKVHHFFVNSRGDNDQVISKSVLRTTYRRIAQLCHPDKGGDQATFEMCRMLYKAGDYEGLVLLQYNLQTFKSDLDTKQAINYAKTRLAALQRKLQKQDSSIGFEALRERVAGRNPKFFLREALRKWLDRLKNPNPINI